MGIKERQEGCAQLLRVVSSRAWWVCLEDHLEGGCEEMGNICFLFYIPPSVQFSSVAQLCLALCNPVDIYPMDINLCMI